MFTELPNTSATLEELIQQRNVNDQMIRDTNKANKKLLNAIKALTRLSAAPAEDAKPKRRRKKAPASE